MRIYNYLEKWKKLLTPEIVSYLTQIHEYKGEQTLFIEAKADTLTQLMEIAKIQSTESSNKIEGIYTSDERLRALVNDTTRPKTRNEKEIAGYRDVLATIHENHDYIPPKASMILQLHRDLYKFEGFDIGGKYKPSDNIIEEEDAEGNKFVRFHPVPAWETPAAMDELCKAFDEALNSGEIDPLILTPMFVLDFLCIHPFKDGNGRISRLLSLLLLYKNGFDAGKYVSFEEQINNNKGYYYETLRESSLGWDTNENTYVPFIQSFLSTLYMCYKELDKRFNVINSNKITKKARIEATVLNSLTAISKAEICNVLPDVSPSTIEAVLGIMVKEGRIQIIGNGKNTRYIANN